MEKLIVAAAQAPSVKGDIEANMATHVKFTQVAIENKVDLIVFPELSLTGYEPDIAYETMIDPSDSRLSPLKELAERHGITIVAGAPILSHKDKPFIGALIIDAEKPGVYLKNHLHPGEEVYFNPGEEKSCIIPKKTVKTALAICADINHPSHAENAAQAGASIYAAGVLMVGGYAEAVHQLRHYAKTHSMAVLMANHASPTGGYIPAGKSCSWDDAGNMLACADETGDALVLLIKQDNFWRGKVIPI